MKQLDRFSRDPSKEKAAKRWERAKRFARPARRQRKFYTTDTDAGEVFDSSW